MLLDLRHERRLHEEMGLACRDVQLGRRSRPLRTMLRALWDALPAAFAAQRRYERLRSGGMPHEMAIRKALGVAPCSHGRPPGEQP
jgi:hypothetical protein